MAVQPAGRLARARTVIRLAERAQRRARPAAARWRPPRAARARGRRRGPRRAVAGPGTRFQRGRLVRHILASRYLLAFLVVTAVAAEFGLARVSDPAALASPRTPVPSRAAVSSAVRACPAPGSGGSTPAGIALAAASAGTGEAKIARLSPV